MAILQGSVPAVSTGISKGLEHRLPDRIAIGVPFGMPLQAHLKGVVTGHADRLDETIGGASLDHETGPKPLNALAMQRVGCDGLAAQKRRQPAIGGEGYGVNGVILTIPGKRDVLAVIEPLPAVVEIGVECPTEVNIELLKASANTQNGQTLHQGRRQRSLRASIPIPIPLEGAVVVPVGWLVGEDRWIQVRFVTGENEPIQTCCCRAPRLTRPLCARGKDDNIDMGMPLQGVDVSAPNDVAMHTIFDMPVGGDADHRAQGS